MLRFRCLLGYSLMNDFYNSFCLTNALSHTNQAVSSWLLLLLFCFLTCLCDYNSTLDLRPLIRIQKETLLPSITLKSFAENHPVLLRCSLHWQISVHRVEKRGKKEKDAHKQLAASSIKPLSVPRRSGGSSFDNNSASCKETGRKEETERLGRLEERYDQVNQIKMHRKIQQVLQSLESLADLTKAVYYLLSRCMCDCTTRSQNRSQLA